MIDCCSHAVTVYDFWGGGLPKSSASKPPDWGKLLLAPTMTLVVRSPFRAKHHVVVQCMARWMKCPLPLPQAPSPSPNPPRPPTPRRQGGQGRIGDIIGKGLRTAVALSTASCFMKEPVTVELGMDFSPFVGPTPICVQRG